MEASAHSRAAPTADERGTTPATTTTTAYAGAGAGGSAAAPADRQGQDARVEVAVDFGDEEKDADEENPEDALLGGHHGKEQLGLSVFGFFKLVSVGVWNPTRAEGAGGEGGALVAWDV